MIFVHQMRHVHSHRVLWLLEELGLSYEVVVYENPRSGGVSRALQQIHPLGPSLVVVDGERVLVEEGCIFDHILNQYDGSNLLRAKEHQDHADLCRFWMHYAQNSLRNVLASKDAASLKVHQDYWEDALRDGWFVGGAFSAADIWVVGCLEQVGNEEIWGSLDRTRACVQACRARDAWVRAKERVQEYGVGLQGREERGVSASDVFAERLEELRRFAHEEVGFEQHQAKSPRSAKTRMKLAYSLLELWLSGDVEPTMEQIAKHAGVSRRSVFHHFGSVDQLYVEAIHVHGAMILKRFVVVDAHLNVREKVRAFVESRAQILEFITPIRRVATAQALRSPVVLRGVRLGQAFLRTDTARVFAKELDGCTKDPQGMESLLCSCSSWSFWASLREEQGFEVEGAKRAMYDVLRSLLKGVGMW